MELKCRAIIAIIIIILQSDANTTLLLQTPVPTEKTNLRIIKEIIRFSIIIAIIIIAIHMQTNAIKITQKLNIKKEIYQLAAVAAAVVAAAAIAVIVVAEAVVIQKAVKAVKAIVLETIPKKKYYSFKPSNNNKNK